MDPVTPATFPLPISALIALPMIGALFVGLDASRPPAKARLFALAFSLLSLAWAIWIWKNAPVCAVAGPRLTESHAWIPQLFIVFSLSLDGIGFLFVFLTGVIGAFAIAASSVTDRARAYYALMLFLQGLLYGTFTASNFIPWFLFWELSLVPAYLLIRIWGGNAAPAAALRFFLLTLAGGVLMLAGFLAIVLATGTFDFTKLAVLARAGQIAPALQAAFPALAGFLPTVIFFGVFAGLAVKVPVFPLHTWLPSAYAEAPAPVTMLLTGVMSKMGIYGMIRILLPVFPAEVRAYSGLLLALAVATIVLSALAALRQTDLKRILAYSSINHVGYCVLGLIALMCAPAGLQGLRESSGILGGVLLQVFNHGIIAGALFFLFGVLERSSGGHRGLSDFGGVMQHAPVLGAFAGIAIFASIGLPGLSGFVGEFLIFKGVFAVAPWAAAAASAGLLLTAVFLLRIQRMVFHGHPSPRTLSLPDLDETSRLVVLPAIVLMFVLGVAPGIVLRVFHPALLNFLNSLPPP